VNAHAGTFRGSEQPDAISRLVLDAWTLGVSPGGIVTFPFSIVTKCVGWPCA
jgi:hypothetical protein